MINRNDIIDALSKCSGYASDRTPAPSHVVIAAWLEHFAQHPSFTRKELLAAVREYFNSPQSRMVQPGDLSGVIQAHHDVANPYPERYVPLPPGFGSDGVTPIASPEHRAKCMDEIRTILNNRWKVPPL